MRLPFLRASGMKCRLQNLKLKYLIVTTAVIIFLVHFTGIFFYVIQEDYFTRYTYPLNVDIQDILKSLKEGKQPSVNPVNEYNYSFLIENENKCKVCARDGNIKVLFVIKSALQNIEKRKVIRRTWGWEYRFSDAGICRIFIVGTKPDDPSVQSSIKSESDDYKDIVQANFVDNYYNLTIKTLVAFKWILNNCLNAQYVMISDDNVYISAKNLLKLLKQHNEAHLSMSQNQPMDTSLTTKSPDDRLYTGEVFFPSPIRFRFSKWYMPLDEYRFSKYPPFCTGHAYVLSKSALIDMYYTSLYTEHFRLEDVFLGIVAKKAGITPLHNDHFNFYKKPYSKFSYSDVIVSHGYDDPDEMEIVWEEQRNLGYA